MHGRIYCTILEGERAYVRTSTSEKFQAEVCFQLVLLARVSEEAVQMGRWLKPEVYPLIAAMSFVTGMCVFQLTRNAFLNPDVRIKKAQRMTPILDNAEDGEKYSQHGFRKLLYRNRPWIFPAADFSSSAAAEATAAAGSNE